MEKISLFLLKRLFCIILFIFKNNYVNAIPDFLKLEDSWAKDKLKSLTLRQKIAQLFIVAAASNFDQPTKTLSTSMKKCPYNLDINYIEKLIREFQIGGIIFLYKSDPITQKKLIDKYQRISKVPLLIAQDCEWGLGMRLDLYPQKIVIYPKNIDLGLIKDRSLIYELGKEIGRQCAVVGIHMNLAPVVDINSNLKNLVIKDRSFGNDKFLVSEYGALYAQGLQDAGVLSCAKHFPGHGDTDIDSHVDLPIINHDLNKLESVELYPFKKLILKNIPAIMSAHIAVPILDLLKDDIKPASLSYDIITKKLKNDMNFKGLTITDGLGMKAVTNYYKPGELELQAFLAGNDILLCPRDVPLAIDFIEQAIISGRVDESDLNNRVFKILKAKKWVIENQKRYINIKNNIMSIEEYLIRPDALNLKERLLNNVNLIKKQLI